VLGLDRVHGTYAEFTALPTSSLYRAPEGVTDQEAVLTEPLANVVHFFRISMTEIPDTLAILGAGPIGILALLVAKRRGIANVIIVDKNDERLAVAKKLRADHVVAASKEDAVESVRRLSDGGADFVIETAGITATRRQAAQCARRGGRLLFIGMTENDSPLPWVEMIREEKSVFTTFCYTPRDFQTSLRMVATRQIDLRAWTETRPIEEGQAAFEKITHHPGSTLKMVFKV
jgi:threonine dehydrogenase-like Zn-dependent dehydrogenase